MNQVIKPTDNIPVGLPVLLRFARRTYSWAVRDALKAAYFDDMPGNGVYVLVGIYLGNAGLGQLVKEIGLSKQAASQLVDALVTRGYVERSDSEDDRRKIQLTLTEKGIHAAEVIRGAIKGVDKELLEEVGEENLQAAKYVLAVLIDINDRRHDLPRGIR